MIKQFYLTHIPQSSWTEALPSDKLMLYPLVGCCGIMGGSYPSAEMESVYSTSSAD